MIKVSFVEFLFKKVLLFFRQKNNLPSVYFVVMFLCDKQDINHKLYEMMT